MRPRVYREAPSGPRRDCAEIAKTAQIAICAQFRARKLADLAVAVLATGRQLVLGCRDRFTAVGTLTWEVGDRAGQFTHRAGYCDTEDALTTLQQVDHFFGRGALVNRGAVGEQGDVGQIANPA